MQNDDIFSKVNKMVIEPRVFTLIARSSNCEVLHLGVHFTLEDAFYAARKRVESLPGYKPGEQIDLDMWNSLSAREVLASLSTNNIASLAPLTQIDIPLNTLTTLSNKLPQVIVTELFKNGRIIKPQQQKAPLQGHKETALSSLKKPVKNPKATKNELMSKMIKEGNPALVNEQKTALTDSEKAYVLGKIQEKSRSLKKKEGKKEEGSSS